MKSHHFLCGVIEETPSKKGSPLIHLVNTVRLVLPWSVELLWSAVVIQPTCLRFGLNSYVYAPKDDAKHRSRWRELYTNEELNQLSQLIHLTKQCGIHFIYALSPGLDIVYSSEKDFVALKKKFDQLRNIGCDSWALLFDDIEDEMAQSDKENFSSFAQAQVSITNQLYDSLNKPDIFIFCPTEYCSRMAKPSVEKSSYLQTIGNGLHPDIDVFWTGPKVVSRRITLSHILSINEVLQRRVTIWDNLNANDYDIRRLCMGPFSSRPINISDRINGLLLNPNCEFELNFVPFNTLSQWFQTLKAGERRDQIDDDDGDNKHNSSSEQLPDIYQVDKALEQSLIEWLPEFSKAKSANDSHPTLKIDHSPQAMSPKSVVSSAINDEDSQDSINELNLSSKVHVMECDAHTVSADLTIDDIRLLVELFYLPYQHGSSAQQLFMDFHWLRYNYNQLENVNEWRCRALLFHNNAKNVSCLLQKLVAIPNRALLYDIYNYINDMNSTIVLCSKYLYWLDDNQKRSSVFMSGDIEPWSKRGGLAGDFLDLLPLGDFQSLLKPEIDWLPNVFFIRPMTSDDQSSIYSLLAKVYYQDDIYQLVEQHPQILADKFIGGYLSSSLANSSLCFVVDNNKDTLSGFLLAIIESEQYDKFIQPKWIEQLYQKYPNVDQNFFESVKCPQWIYDQYTARVEILIDLTIKADHIYYLASKLMKILSENLSARGYHGCHAFVDGRNTNLHQFYLSIGFIDIPTIDQNDHLILLGKKI